MNEERRLQQINTLVRNLPYPRHWYEQKNERQLYAIYMNYINKELDKIKAVYDKDDLTINSRIVIQSKSQIPIKADGTIDLEALQAMHAVH